jgi:hypothetical protein
MKEAYILDGSALDLFKNKFELIHNLMDMQDDQDSLTFDLEWLIDPDHRMLFVDLAEGRAIGKMVKNKLQLFKPYTRSTIESFITFMGYGRPGMGTVYTTRNRATPAQAKESYNKALKAMLEEFKEDFAYNAPQATLGHGNGKPRAAPIALDLRNNMNWRFNNMNSESESESENENKGPNIRINNNIALYGKASGKKTAKNLRKGLPKNMRTRKIKNWTRNKNNMN